MRGDRILVKEEYRRIGQYIAEILLKQIIASPGKYAIAVAGESGSGKSTVALVLATALEKYGIRSLVLQQDDYYVYPPKTNDRARRQDNTWSGTREVNLALLDQQIKYILNGKRELVKPLVLYEEDCIDTEILNVEDVRVVIVEGSYTMLLQHVNTRIFIKRTYLDTRANREKRARYKAELDKFTENILKIEHDIISKHKVKADIIVSKEYEVTKVS